jgi:hypothetical protein
LSGYFSMSSLSIIFYSSLCLHRRQESVGQSSSAFKCLLIPLFRRHLIFKHFQKFSVMGAFSAFGSFKLAGFPLCISLMFCFCLTYCRSCSIFLFCLDLVRLWWPGCGSMDFRPIPFACEKLASCHSFSAMYERNFYKRNKRC